MLKIISCPHCGGSGDVCVTACDECGGTNYVGKHDGKDFCFECWAKKLTPEEIQAL
jgi:RecJ-like exonuclease